ncbi:MAG: GGDEF domain-containing protein [Myxococcales bacterium]|nr:GGDEF domain-containing protein [Myxococcales bacterium]MCB9581187.1 GGDEF domain-containing protein [Polyangiaceae bacterium]
MSDPAGGQRPAGAPRTLKADAAVSSEVLRRVKAPHRPVLVVMTGGEHDVGRRVVMDRTVIVGRDPAAALCLSDGLVSWQHARLEDRGDGWAIVDLGSTNGVMLNGEHVNDALVRPGDTLVFGSTVVRLELQDGAAQAMNQVVERLLNIDDLSGLYVRRKFDAELAPMIDAARNHGSSVALLVMDLDGVKGINDTHGHLFGAYVIGEAGRVIGSVLGSRGIACRFGGDEYLAALSGFGAETGAQVAEEIRAAVNAHHFEREGIPLHPGISIGVAGFPENAQDAASLFQRADEALYRAKVAGKNRVCR